MKIMKRYLDHRRHGATRLEALGDAIPRNNDPVAVVLVCDAADANVTWLAPVDVRSITAHRASVVLNVHKSGKLSVVKSRYA